MGGSYLGTEPRLLAVNCYDDTLRVYDRGYCPNEALMPPQAEEEEYNNGHEASSPTASTTLTPPAAASPVGGGGGGDDNGLVRSENPSPVPATHGSSHSSSNGKSGNNKNAGGGNQSNGSSLAASIDLSDQLDQEEASAIHALQGVRNRSYPIRSALRVGAEYGRGGRAVQRSSVVDTSVGNNSFDDDDRRRVAGAFMHDGEDGKASAPAPTVHSTVLLASGSADGDAYLYDVSGPPGSGELVQRLRGHTDRVYAVGFHPHEPLLASGSADFTVRLWAPQSQQQNGRRDRRGGGMRGLRLS